MTSYPLPPPPRSRDEGEWGARAPWWCEDCGPVWRMPRLHQYQIASMEQEPLWEWFCECGGQVYEPGGPYVVRVVGRRRVLRAMRGAA